MDKFLKKNHKIIIAIVASFFVLVSVLNANNDATTFDEVAHIPAGYTYLTQHDTRINPEHPPLIKDISAFPLIFMDLNFNTKEKFWTGELPRAWDEGQWAAGRHLLYEAENDSDAIVFWSRIPIVILSLILGLFLYMWGKKLAGIVGGLIAFTLYSFDPNILGHNHLVTTDIGVAAFLVFAFYFFLKFMKKPTPINILLLGLFLGLLLASKFSSIVALPVFAISLSLYSLAKRSDSNPHFNWKNRIVNLITYGVKFSLAFLVAIAVIWTIYKVNTFEMPKETFAKTIEFFFPAEDTNLKTQYTNKTLNTLNESDLTRPLGTYLFGPAWMFKRVSGGNGAYFLGEVGNGFTWYFPVVFMIKESIPFLLLLFFTGIYTVLQSLKTIKECGTNLKKIGQRFEKFLRTSLTGYTFLGFIVLYAFLSINGGLNIGFRHLFPILPFAYLLVSKKIVEFYKRSSEHSRKTFSVIVGILMTWLIVGTLSAYPYYISYFNEAVGGPKNGYKIVTDSNADWGQDIKRLKKYLNNHPEINKIRIDYFGGADIYQTIGEDRTILWWDSKRPIENGWYAISANFMQGSIHSDEKNKSNSYQWLLDYEPVDRVGTSIFIYHITDR